MPLIVHDATTVLDLLRESSAHRAIHCIEGQDDLEYAVVEIDAMNRPIKAIAWLDQKGTAYALRMQAYEADMSEDMPLWASLPLRYGPDCSTWVLPESPLAPQKPGAA